MISKIGPQQKICLITWCRSMNYGTCLQAFALYRKLQDMGFDVVMPDRLRIFSYREPIDALRRVKAKAFGKLRTMVRKKSLDECLRAEFAERMRRIDSFIHENIVLRRMTDRPSYAELSREMDAFVAGSDQIWNPKHLSLPFLLSFVDDETRKVAYGSSLGVDRVPQRMRRTYRKYLSRFHAIGVREAQAARDLSQLLSRPVEVVLDPTFLLDRDAWLQLAELAEFLGEIQSGGFLFCYFIGASRDWIPEVCALEKQYGLPVYVALSEALTIPDLGKPFAAAGPREFLWMLANAAVVCTDSFHAAALSLNMGTQMLVFKRFRDEEKDSQNARIYHLLDTFGIRDRLVAAGNSAIQAASRPIDYEKVGQVLEKERARSEEYLHRALRDE